MKLYRRSAAALQRQLDGARGVDAPLVEIPCSDVSLHWIGRYAIGGPIPGREVKRYLDAGQFVYTRDAQYVAS